MHFYPQQYLSIKWLLHNVNLALDFTLKFFNHTHFTKIYDVGSFLLNLFTQLTTASFTSIIITLSMQNINTLS